MRERLCRKSDGTGEILAMLKILIPEKKGAVGIAAAEFASLWCKVTGARLPVTRRDDRRSDLVVLGSDACNAFTHRKIVEKVIPQFSLVSGSDAYALRSATDIGGRRLLFIAGGRPRAALERYRHTEAER